MAATLGRLFWRDLELHHPGICSLNLVPEVAAAWKQRVLVKTTTSIDADGQPAETHHLRSDGRAQLGQVRAFYLDIARWAMEEPARWGLWAAPCPIRREDLTRTKENRRRKSRMDQRTRERLPALPALVARVHTRAQVSADRLRAAEAAGHGEQFTCHGQELHRAPLRSGSTAKIWSEDPATGARRDLTGEEDRAFWTWAAIETLRHTGIRIEELTELSHHSLVQYTPPTSTEVIPLLQIAPSKTDTERLLVVSPELADVLAAVIHRIRQPSGAVACVASYDPHERVWNPPMPLLFQRKFGMDNRAIPSGTIRDWICESLPETSPADTEQADHSLTNSAVSHCGSPRTTSGGSSSPTPSCTACLPTSLNSSPGTVTSTRPWATKLSIPRKPSTAIVRSSPDDGRCDPVMNTGPPPIKNGRSSSATSSTARCPWALVAAPTPRPASTNTPACAALSYARTQPNDTASSTSATTSSPASTRPATKDGSEKSRACRSASTAPAPNSCNSTSSPPSESPNNRHDPESKFREQEGLWLPPVVVVRRPRRRGDR